MNCNSLSIELDIGRPRVVAAVKKYYGKMVDDVPIDDIRGIVSILNEKSIKPQLEKQRGKYEDLFNKMVDGLQVDKKDLPGLLGVKTKVDTVLNNFDALDLYLYEDYIYSKELDKNGEPNILETHIHPFIKPRW